MIRIAWVIALVWSLSAALAWAQPPDSTGSVTPVSPDSTASAPRESPDLLQRAKNGAKYFVSDVWWVFSSPARLNRRSAFASAVVLGAVGTTYAYDQDLYDATQRNQDEQPFKSLMDFADSYVEIGFMPNAFKVEAGVALLGYAFRSEPLRQIPIECIESHLIAGGLRNILKPLVGRAHPYENKGPRDFEFGEGTSFPSGHTSVLFEVATVVSEHVHSTPVTVGLFGLATLGAVQRVESQNHWASDVLFPAVTGTVIAHTIVRRNAERRAAATTGSLEQPQWTPMLGMSQGGWMIGASRRF